MFARTILPLCLAIATCLFATSCGRNPAPPARQGVLDLRGVDLDRQTVLLDGPWEAHLGLLAPDSPELRTNSGREVAFPGPWTSLFGRENPQRTATFKLVLLVDPERFPRLQFQCTEHSSSYRLFADGQLLFADGTPGTSPDTETPGYHFRQNRFQPRSERIELVIQASNHHLDYTGPIFRLQMGSERTMENRHEIEKALFLGALGILILLTVQYLGFLGILTREPAHLLLGTSCLFLAGMGIFIPAGFCFATSWWPELSLQATTITGLVCTIVGLNLLSRFCEAMFPDPILRLTNRMNSVIVALAALTMVLGPYRWVYPAMGVVLATDYLLVMACCKTLFQALRKRESGSLSFTIGLGLFMAAAVHDSLIFFGAIDSSYIISLGCTAFCVTEAFVLTRRWWTTDQANARLLADVQNKNQELARVSRLKDEFLANTSHELRTPLHGIHGLAQSILSDPSTDLGASTRRNLEHVVVSARRLTRLVNDILDFAKIRHKDLDLRPKPLDLAILLPTIPPHFQATADHKGITLHTQVDADLPLVLADEDRLMQVLFNLVGNAVKFTDWGSVTVGARKNAGSVEVSVTDTGLGIDSVSRERIFEPFEQAEGLHRGGTGLGLSISRQLVELHGSRLELSSIPGEGSTFWFSLPCATNEPRANPAPEPPKILAPPPADSTPSSFRQIPSRDSYPRWVLAIDDEPINLMILGNLLNAEGIGVVFAPDGRDALDLIESHQPEVVLLDVMMPFRDGYEVCREIRSRHTSADLPVLFLSARSRLEDVIDGFTAGGNDYVLKPFLGPELVARVQAQMRQRDIHRALQENRSLKMEVADLALERSQLESAKRRLASVFDAIEEPILVIDSRWTIRFGNRAWSGRSGASLPSDPTEHLLQDLLDPTVPIPEHPGTDRLELRFPGSDSSGIWRATAFTDGSEELWVLVPESSEAEPGTNPLSRMVIQKLATSEERLAQLRGRMDLLSDELQMDLPIGELQSTLSQIRSMVSDHPDEESRLAKAAEILNQALDLWVSTTKKSKADLAEESGLWSIHMDPNGWRRTATLDKYLDPAKIPSLPKWKTIFKTVDFVVRAAGSDPRVQSLSEAKSLLEASLAPSSRNPGSHRPQSTGSRTNIP